MRSFNIETKKGSCGSSVYQSAAKILLLLCSVKKLIKVVSFRPGWNLGDNCAHAKPLGFKLSNCNLRQDGDFLPLGGLVLFFWGFLHYY